MHFNFIDKITQYQEKHFCVGKKTVSLYETPYFYQDKIYPMLLLEAIGQLNAWITMPMNDFKVRPVAILYGEITIYDSATYHDELMIATRLHRYDEATSLFDGKVNLQNKTLLEVKNAAGSFLDIHEFAYPDDYRNQFTQLLNEGLTLEAMANQTIANLFHYDKSHQETKTQLTAYKKIGNYAFLKDHFPKKPILPISILLQNNIELGKLFILENFVENLRFRKIVLKHIKMRAPITPGALLQTQIDFVNQSDTLITCKLINKVANKVVCNGMIEYYY